jgi:hypothetical protein
VPDRVVNSIKTYTKAQAICVMTAGGILLTSSILLPTEPGTTGHTVRVLVGIIGVIVILWGTYKRPVRKELTR